MTCHDKFLQEADPLVPLTQPRQVTNRIALIVFSILAYRLQKTKRVI